MQTTKESPLGTSAYRVMTAPQRRESMDRVYLTLRASSRLYSAKLHSNLENCNFVEVIILLFKLPLTGSQLDS